MKWKPILFLLLLMGMIWFGYYLISTSGLLEGKYPVNTDTIHDIPSVLSNVVVDKDNYLTLQLADGTILKHIKRPSGIPGNFIEQRPVGTETGIVFNFSNKNFSGVLHYNIIEPGNIYTDKTFRYSKSVDIEHGTAHVTIEDFSEKSADAGRWQKSGKRKMVYRIVDQKNNILHDSRVNISGTGPFTTHPTVIAGPFLSCLGGDSLIIWMVTDAGKKPEITFPGDEGEIFSSSIYVNGFGHIHKFLIKGLQPATSYSYKIVSDGFSEADASFFTSPEEGSTTPFSFVFSSDSRAGSRGAGEGETYGVNTLILNRMMAEAYRNNISFFQFTGNLVNGYAQNREEMLLQYMNWKHAVEPYASSFPVFTGHGMHENHSFHFPNAEKQLFSINSFPYHTVSSEALFAALFQNPENGPQSEDGAVYDPDMNTMDFPPYNRTVYWYRYGNMAMIVLNSNYWHTLPDELIATIGGNPTGYIMDNQLEWLINTLLRFEKDNAIDHLFVSLHTSPVAVKKKQGDAVSLTKNNVKPFVAGKPVPIGYIQRKNELLSSIVNHSSKTVALLCGEGYNYSRLLVDNALMQAEGGQQNEQLVLSRPLWQISVGAGDEKQNIPNLLSYPAHTKCNTKEQVICLFSIEGSDVQLTAINVFSGDIVDQIKLK